MGCTQGTRLTKKTLPKPKKQTRPFLTLNLVPWNINFTYLRETHNQVLRAAREAAVGAPGDTSVSSPGRSAAARVNLTAILAGDFCIPPRAPYRSLLQVSGGFAGCLVVVVV